MTNSHFFDVKIPLGWLLTFYGAVLTTYGLVSNSTLYQKSLDINVNLIWGTIMFGLGMLLLLISCHIRTQKKRRQSS